MYTNLFESLRLLPPFEALQILKCSALPRMTHLLRSLSPQVTEVGASWFDLCVLETCNKLVSGDRLSLRPGSVQVSSMAQISLPARAGGFGLRSCVRTSAPAFFASMAMAMPALVENRKLFGDESAYTASEEDMLLAREMLLQLGCDVSDLPGSVEALWSSFEKGAPPHFQKLLTAQVERALAQSILNNESDPVQQARLRSLSQPGSTYYLSVLPSDRFSFIPAVLFPYLARLHLDLPPANMPSHCPVHGCNEPLHGSLNHFTSCAKLRRTMLLNRHDNVKHTLSRLLKLVGVAVSEELPAPLVPPSPPRSPRPSSSPAAVAESTRIVPDLTFNLGGVRQYLDVSCTNPCSRSYVSKAATKSLHAADRRSVEKASKYYKLARLTHAEFIPFVLEVYGAFSSSARAFIEKLVPYAETSTSGLSASEFRRRAYHEISVALHLGNGYLLQHAFSLFPHSSDHPTAFQQQWSDRLRTAGALPPPSPVSVALWSPVSASPLSPLIPPRRSQVSPIADAPLPEFELSALSLSL